MKSNLDFPSKEEYKKYLRMYFAGLAMQGLLTHYLSEHVTGWSTETYAQESVLLADELLKHLEDEKT